MCRIGGRGKCSEWVAVGDSCWGCAGYKVGAIRDGLVAVGDGVGASGDGWVEISDEVGTSRDGLVMVYSG